MRKKIKKLLNKFLKVEYYPDGKCAICLKHKKKTPGEENKEATPITPRFDAGILYKIFCASSPIVPNKIVVDNYMGKGFGCNPKYVVEKLLEKYPGELEIVWLASKGNFKKELFPEGVRLARYDKLDARKELATAQVWLFNYHKISMIRKGLRKRPGQYYIQMWHGSLGIKKIENDAGVLTQDKSWLNLAKMNSHMTDLWVSNSTFETEVYKRAFWDVENVVEWGHPRNDILLNGADQIQKKVKEAFGVEDKKILFYAPTFREDYRLDCYQIDYENLSRKLTEKFGGEWVFFIRLHPRVQKFASQVIPDSENMFDVTKYPDIQELIAAADCMITDYSSCIFDFVVTGRPGFIFAKDLSAYNTERGFYYPLESTPFPVAQDNAGLMQNIENFDTEKFCKECETFLEGKGCVDDGNASERVADRIMEIVRANSH